MKIMTGIFITAEFIPIKPDAVVTLNEALDSGFEDARIINKIELQKMMDFREPGKKIPLPPFTIQLLALKNPVDFSFFRNPEKIQRFESKDGYHRYVTGVYDNYEKASGLLERFVSGGFTDAFVMELSRYTTTNGNNENDIPEPEEYLPSSLQLPKILPNQEIQ